MKIGVVIIGRNEGERLVACLASVIGADQERRVIYVDSGSTDDSVAAAKKVGAEVVNLDMSQPFTAARARNAGADLLLSDEDIEAIQFVDGDCEIIEGWFDKAESFLSQNPKAAAVCGRRCERHPAKNVFHSLAEREWNTPVGQAKSCGGDVLMRRTAFEEVGGYNPDLIAGEEPEMCLRLREKGWEIHRIRADMAWHDIAISSLSPWWKRAARSGHAFAEVSDLHEESPKRIWAKETKRAVIWASFLPIIILLGLLIHPIAYLALLIYPLQIFRVGSNLNGPDRFKHAALYILGRFAEAWGVLKYQRKKMTGTPTKLMEYKS